MPVEADNDLVKDPSMGNKMENVMGDIKPEAVYYCSIVARGPYTLSSTWKAPTRYLEYVSPSGTLSKPTLSSYRR